MAARSMRDLAYYDWSQDDVRIACQLAVAKARDGRELLAASPALSPSAWDEIWRKGLPAGMAKALLSRPLLERQCARAIAEESRPTVLTCLAQWNCLPAEQAVALSRNGAVRVRDAALKQASLPRDAREALLLTCSPEASLHVVAGDPNAYSVGDEAVVRLLGSMDYEGFRSFFLRSLLLQAVVFNRSTAREFAASPAAHTALAVAAASSPLLGVEQARALASRAGQCSDLKFLLMALAANPVVPPEVVALIAERVRVEPDLAPAGEAVTRVVESRQFRLPLAYSHASEHDQDVLAKLLRRALPSDTSRGRPFELALLLGNPALGPDDRQRVIGGLWTCLGDTAPSLIPSLAGNRDYAEFFQCFSRPAPGPAARDQLLEQAASALGASVAAWECLVLMLDEFDGTFTDLIGVAAAV